MCNAIGHVRFTPNSDRESGFSQRVMSALPPKADMCGALADVCFGPIADSCSAANKPLFDHLVGTGEQRRRHREAECFGGREIEEKIEVGIERESDTREIFIFEYDDCGQIEIRGAMTR
jgi:CRISPR/Cas system CSM-associated protein Csm3 (group 7 of RAMP superfamily)